MIPKKKLDQLVAEFREHQERGSYEQQRAEWWSGFSFDVTEQWIEDLSEDEALQLYKKTGWGVKLYNNTFRENGLDNIKKSLRYLLYGTDPIEKRFYNVVDGKGKYKLKGIGREFSSFLLCMHDNQQFGIWNTPVEEGLKLLDLSPRKIKGEHSGQTYVSVLERLKVLREKGGFDDLQFVDEFLELTAKGFIGESVFALPVGPSPDVEEEEHIEISPNTANQHTRIQWMLINIGLMEGHDVWVASGDRNKISQGETLGDSCLSELPHFAGPNVLEIARHIDVIWFKKHTATPVNFFEVEHSTSIYSGLLRINDVIIDYPVQKAAIVAPKEKQDRFERQVSRRTFNHSGLAGVSRFMTYKDVEKLYEIEQTRQQLL